MNYIAHHGILGQKWGVRRYQNEDGTLTPEGRERYQEKEYKLARKTQARGYRSNYDRMRDYSEKSSTVAARAKELNSLAKEYRNIDDELFEYEIAFEGEVNKRAFEKAKKDPNWDVSDPHGMTKHNDRLFEWYKIEDNTEEEVFSEHAKKDKQLGDLLKRRSDALKAYKQKRKELADDIIGNYGDIKISGLGTDMNYRELVTYALTHNVDELTPPETYEEEMGRKKKYSSN